VFCTFGLFGLLSFLFFSSVVPLQDIFPLFIYLFKTKGSIENKRMLEPRLKVLFESSSIPDIEIGIALNIKLMLSPVLNLVGTGRRLILPDVPSP
jgi:hypothetical protein